MNIFNEFRARTDRGELQGAYSLVPEIIRKSKQSYEDMFNWSTIIAPEFVEKCHKVGVVFEKKEASRSICIGIPTFNRPSELFQLLSSLCLEISLMDVHIRVYVHDNSDTYSSGGVGDIFSKLFPFFRYKKNMSNVGADINIVSLDMLEYDFVWTIGDDDLVIPGSISKISDIIRSSHIEGCALLAMNRICTDPRGRNFDKSRIAPGTKIRKLSSNVAISMIGRELLSVSMFARRKVPYLEISQKYMVGKLVSPLALNLNALVQGSCIFFEEPMIIYRDGDKSDWIHRWRDISHRVVPQVFAAFAAEGFFPESIVEKID